MTSDSARTSSRHTAVFDEHQRQVAQRSRRRYGKAALLLALVLLAGVVIGVGGTLAYVRSKMKRPPPRADQIGRSLLEHMGRQVVLTPDEQARIEAIIDSHMEAVEEVRSASFGRIRDEFDAMNDKIDEVLGPQRSEQWENDKRQRYGKHYRGKNERHVHPSRREPGH